MQVQLKTHLKHSGQEYEAGSVLDLPEDLAEELLDCGSAKHVIPEAPETADDETRLRFDQIVAAKDETIAGLQAENDALRGQVASYLATQHPDGAKAQALLAQEAAGDPPADTLPADDSKKAK